jgi:glycosyltransferase involved in cell wall biosynthesis
VSLSVCYLTRNEADVLPRSIRSVAGVADHVVFADTVSAYGTAAAAAAAGAQVFEFPWDDDFAAGRNFAIARATGDWVLWLNADEELTPESIDRVRRCAAGGGGGGGGGDRAIFGYFVRVQNLMKAGDPSAVALTSDLRLFRRRPDLRYVGRLHPGFTDELVAAVTAEGMRVDDCDVMLRRHAYRSEPTEAKLRFTLRLLERELRDRPGQLRYLIELGRVLLRLKDPRGHGVLMQAAAQVLPLRYDATPPGGKAQVLLEYLLDLPPERLPADLPREQVQELALRWFPLSPRLMFKLAEQWFRAGDADRAAGILERLVELGRRGTYDRTQSFDLGLVQDDAVVNLAACYRRRGRLDEAERCYVQLLGSRHFAAHARQGLAAVRAAKQGLA